MREIHDTMPRGTLQAMLTESPDVFNSPETADVQALSAVVVQLAGIYRQQLASPEFSLADQSDIELAMVDRELTVVATGGYHVGFDLLKASQIHPEIRLLERDLEATKIDTLRHPDPKELFIEASDEDDETPLSLAIFHEVSPTDMTRSELQATVFVLKEQLEALTHPVGE